MTRGKAAMVVVAALVMALLVVFALELADTQAKSKADVRHRVNERASLAAALIESLFQSSAQQAPQNARLYGGTAVTDERLALRRATNRYLVLLDPSGRVLARAGSTPPAELRAVMTSSAVRLVRSGRPYGLGDIRGSGSAAVVDFAVPVPTAFGRRILVSGVPGPALSAFIARELRRIPGVRGARNYLIDGRLTVIASTNPARPAGYRFASPAQRKALSRRSGEARGLYYDQVALADSTWKLVVAAPTKRLFANVSGLRKWVPWIIFIGFVLVSAAAFVLAQRMLRSAAQARSAGIQLADANRQLERTNRELERRAAELARSNDELDQFASIASHDLQEPLRKVRTFTQRLTEMEQERLSEKGQDYLRRADSAAERMQRLVEDLLRFSRVATQTRPFSPVDLAELTRGVLDDLSHQIDRAGATVSVGELPVINGDALQLRQLVQNLVSNGLKFRREGVPPQIRIGADVHGDVVELEVEDNGIGFEPEYGDRIFRVFERLHARSQYPGTGIGLALCRKIAERHGGTIRAEGRPGEGARFVVTLPVDQQEEVIRVSDRSGVLSERAPVGAAPEMEGGVRA